MRMGLMARAKRMGDRGSPWGTPVEMVMLRGSQPRLAKETVVSDKRKW